MLNSLQTLLSLQGFSQHVENNPMEIHHSPVEFQTAPQWLLCFPCLPSDQTLVWGLSALTGTFHSKRDVGTQESSKTQTGRGAFEVSASLLGQLHPNRNSGGSSRFTHTNPWLSICAFWGAVREQKRSEQTQGLMG